MSDSPVDEPVGKETKLENDGVLRAGVEQIVSPFLDRKESMGLVVGTLRQGRANFFGFGRISRDNPAAPDEYTLYEIGSITKVFTANVLADMVLAGQLRLSEPVQRHLPDRVRVPDYRGQAITLFHLATHTSSLPRLPDNLDATIRDKKNPYADYTVGHLYDFLNKCRLRRRIGNMAEYSNLGAGLLGHVLERVAQKRYEELVVARLCRPLEMGDAVIALSDEQRQRLAPGHDDQGEPTANWDIPTLAGAGAFRSTTSDLLRYLQANLSPSERGHFSPSDASPAAERDAPMREEQRLRAALARCQLLRTLKARPDISGWMLLIALVLAGIGVFLHGWWPIRPGSLPFLVTLLLPTVLSSYFLGLYAGLTAAAASVAGNVVLWGGGFAWYVATPAALFLAFTCASDRGSFKVALGWQHLSLPNGCLLLWHNGGTGGYRSWCGMVRENQTATVVLANCHVDADSIGMKVIELLGRHEDEFFA